MNKTAKILYFMVLIVLILVLTGCTTTEKKETDEQLQDTLDTPDEGLVIEISGEPPQNMSENSEGDIIINLD